MSTNGQVAQSGEPEAEIDPVDQFPGERRARDGRAGVYRNNEWHDREVR